MIHASAVVHPGARLGDGVTVGPYTVIGEHVEIGAGTWIGPHVVITGRTRIGRDNRIYQFNSIGEVPQDMKYAGEPTLLEIGDRNTIREFCTLNCGTVQDSGVTHLGSDNWIMAYAHLAHDCQVGNHTIFANNAQLAGHVHVGDYAVLGAKSGVHQYAHVGAHSMCAAGSILLRDLPPYVMASGYPAKPHGINAEGLKRRGFSADAIASIKRAYKTLYRSGLTLAAAQAELEAQCAEAPEIAMLVEFLSNANRGIIR